MTDFTKEEKADAFDLIAAHYYERNFGSLSKSYFETIMFSIYLEHCRKNDSPTDDYSLSKELGISQTKIRTLKQNEALQLNASRTDHWKQEFAKYARYARYDSAKQLVKMTVPEVIVLDELRHFIVCNNLYDEYQLNPRLFQCRLDVFVELCGLLDGDGVSFDSDILDKLQENVKEGADKSAIEMIRSGNWKEGRRRKPLAYKL